MSEAGLLLLHRIEALEQEMAQAKETVSVIGSMMEAIKTNVEQQRRVSELQERFLVIQIKQAALHERFLVAQIKVAERMVKKDSEDWRADGDDGEDQK